MSIDRSKVRNVALFICGALVLGAVGCGSGATVGGKVLINNKPLPNAELRFQLASDPAENTFSGMSRESGEFIIDTRGKGSIPPGEYKITVNWWMLRDGKPIPGGEEGAALKDDPAKTVQYSVVFEKTLNSGENLFDLPLEKGKRIFVPPVDGS